MKQDFTEPKNVCIDEYLNLRFGLEHSFGLYTLRRVMRIGNRQYVPCKEGNEVALYKLDDEGDELVGFITPYGYSFLITADVCGITLTKEIAYNELQIRYERRNKVKA